MTIFLAIVLLSSSTVLAENGGPDVSSRVTRLIEEVDALEKNQQEILDAQNKIFQKIQSLKITSRR